MSRCLPYKRASLMAASLASAPELQKKRSVHTGYLAQALAEFVLQRNLIQVGCVHERCRLLTERAGDCRMTMTQSAHGDTAHGIEIALSVVFPQPGAFTTREGHWQPVVGINQVTAVYHKN